MADFKRGGIPEHFIGLSTDTKPAVCGVMSRAYETDTGKEFITADGGTTWVEYILNKYFNNVVIADDKLLKLGTDGDQVLVNRSAILNADTALAAEVGQVVTRLSEYPAKVAEIEPAIEK